MKFTDVIITPYIRRVSWPVGEYATAKKFTEPSGKTNWYWERRVARQSSFYSTRMDIPGDDWERYTPDFLKDDGGSDG